MKTIKVLKLLINILYFALITLFLIIILLWISTSLFYDSLPFYIQEYKTLLHQFFSWELKLLLMPITKAINYILFTVSIFFLRKSIRPFTESNFYSIAVSKNLKKSGVLFIIIGLTTIVIQFITVMYIQSFAPMHIGSFKSFIYIMISTIDLKSTFLIIIGLFFLLFSKGFENAKKIKRENDLTI
jgi:hypothetical protein